jgi:formylglycine-generating enzyme required for sulfatase activity
MRWGTGGAAARRLPANCAYNPNTPYLAVGSEPGGNGRCGHSDLGGSMLEWLLDGWEPYPDSQTECSDCALVTESYFPVVCGGWWFHSADRLRATRRDPATSQYADSAHGVRWTRSAP